ALDTVICTAPEAAAGATAVILVLLLTTTAGAGVPPKDTWLSEVKPVPVIVTTVPPPPLPDDGDTALTVGAGTLVKLYWSGRTRGGGARRRGPLDVQGGRGRARRHGRLDGRVRQHAERRRIAAAELDSGGGAEAGAEHDDAVASRAGAGGL